MSDVHRPRFKRDDRVRLKDEPAVRGTIVRLAGIATTGPQYLVAWDDRPAATVAKRRLEVDQV